MPGVGRGTMLVMPYPHSGSRSSSTYVSASGTRPERNSNFQNRLEKPAKWCPGSADRTPGLIPTKRTRTPGRIRSRSSGSAGVLLAGRRHPFERELLQAHRGLRQIEVALRIGGHLMSGVFQPRWLDRSQDRERLSIDDHDVVAVADVEKLLLPVRRQRHVPGKWRIRFHELLDEFAFSGERL